MNHIHWNISCSGNMTLMSQNPAKRPGISGGHAWSQQSGGTVLEYISINLYLSASNKREILKWVSPFVKNNHPNKKNTSLKHINYIIQPTHVTPKRSFQKTFPWFRSSVARWSTVRKAPVWRLKKQTAVLLDHLLICKNLITILSFSCFWSNCLRRSNLCYTSGLHLMDNYFLTTYDDRSSHNSRTCFDSSKGHVYCIILLITVSIYLYLNDSLKNQKHDAHIMLPPKSCTVHPHLHNVVLISLSEMRNASGSNLSTEDGLGQTGWRNMKVWVS